MTTVTHRGWASVSSSVCSAEDRRNPRRRPFLLVLPGLLVLMGVLSEVSEEVEIGNKLRNFASLPNGSISSARGHLHRQKGFAMVKGFKDFLMRGNVVDLAVAVVIGAAFGAVVTAFVGGIINPLIAAIFGQPDISRVGNFVLNEAQFSVGSVLQAIVNFLLVAAAVYFAVVVPMNHLQERRKAGI